MNNSFEEKLKDVDVDGLYSDSLKIIQVNMGYLCNQSCRHCHVNASPLHKEIMQKKTMEFILDATSGLKLECFDLTGGAPELNPHFRWFVEALVSTRQHVQVRTNLTALLEPGNEALPDFLKIHGVKLVASMPCYLEDNVNDQRGVNVYEKSIAAIKKLNELGYGKDPKLILNLVYNPKGAFLPPPQMKLEFDYHREFQERFGIVFNRLLTITNMPIGRFLKDLKQQNKDKDYRLLLKKSFNPHTIDTLMCRHQISIGWDGRIYDCDFNLALDTTINHGTSNHIKKFDIESLSRRRIVTGLHCFGCTAGYGSSCKGALT